jgi:hypothetical protein
VLHLVAEASLEEALLDAPASAPDAAALPGSVDVTRLLDEPAGGAFLSGAALASLIAQVRDVLQAIG